VAKDKFHDIVKRALIKDSWNITHDPLIFKFGKYDQIQIDLGAEKILAAEKDDKKIAVEIKSFLSDSAISDFHGALGQFLNYHFVLEQIEPERILFLAIPIYAYESFFQRDLPQAIINRYNLKLIVYDPIKGVISQWIN